MEEQLYDDISVPMIETTGGGSVRGAQSGVFVGAADTSTLFSNSRLISEYDVESRIYMETKKKKFRRDHL
jgi:hypothetical protein